jgi:hypothetical protein
MVGTQGGGEGEDGGRRGGHEGGRGGMTRCGMIQIILSIGFE